MGEIYYDQILIVVFQCFVVGILLLSLFKARSIFGLSLLYTSLGVFQYMQVFLVNALYFEIAPGILVSSGSAVLFTGSLFAILLVYIKEDTLEARKLIYAILSANIILSILQYVISIGFEGESVVNIYNLPKEIFTHNTRVLLVGTFLLFLDTFLIIFIYELISKFIKSLFFRISFSMIIILSMDSILFPIGAFSNLEQIQGIIVSGLISKNLAAIIYAIIFTLYIQFIDKGKITLGVNENKFKDIFQSLTFRQKYEHAVEENLLQKKDLETSRMRYKYFVERTNEGFFRMESTQPIPTNLPPEIQIQHMFKYMYVAECNEIFARSYGYNKAADIIGFSFNKLIHGRSTQTENLKSLTYFIEANYQITDGNTKVLSKKGEECFYLNNSIGIVENNSLVAFWGTQRDITEKKKIEIALENEKTLFKAIVDNIPVMITLYNPKIDMLFFNKEFETKIGYTTKEANETDFIAKIYPTVALGKQARDFMLSGSKGWKEFPLINKKGETINSEWTNIRLENGTQIGIGLDITERKIANDKLLKSNSFLVNTLENMTDGYVSLNNNWVYTYVNQKAGELLGRNPQELVGKHIWTEFPEGIDQPFYNNYHKAKETQKPIIFEEFFEPWKMWFENRVVPNENGLAIFFQNITERKLIQNKIIEEKLKAQQYLNVAGVMLLSIDPLGTIKLINPKGCEILGYKEDEILEENWFDKFIPKEERESIREVSKKIFSGELKSVKYYENEIITKSGEKRLIGWINENLLDENGKIIGVLSSGEDITERKNAESTLKLSEEKYRTLFENAPEGILIADKNSNYLDANDTMCKMLGYTYSEFVGLHAKDIVIQSEYQNIDPALNTINRKEEYNKEWQFKRKDNSVFSAEVMVTTMPDGNLLGLIRDITERKIAEEELIKYNKRLQLLHNIDSAILTAKNQEEIASEVLNAMGKIIPYKHASFATYNVENSSFNLISIKSISAEFEQNIGILNSSDFQFIDIEGLVKGKIQIIEDLRIQKNPSLRIQKFIDVGLNTILIFPLVYEKKLIGVLGLLSNSMDAFSNSNIEIITQISYQLSIVISQNNLKNEIKKYTEDLEEKIVERTAQLKFSNEELKDFAQIVSHDLKAPLRAISQLSHWLSEDYSDKIDTEGKEHLSMLVSRAKRMDDLIEGILQYSKASKSKEKESIINLNKLVKDVIISLAPPKNITITIDNKLPEILGDATRFSQLFQNLINNAIKFIDKPIGNVNIGCEIGNGFWKFYVADKFSARLSSNVQ